MNSSLNDFPNHNIISKLTTKLGTKLGLFWVSIALSLIICIIPVAVGVSLSLFDISNGFVLLGVFATFIIILVPCVTSLDRYQEKHKQWCLEHPLVRYEYPDNVENGNWIIVRRITSYGPYRDAIEYNLINKNGILFSVNWFSNIYRASSKMRKFGPFVFVDEMNRVNILRWNAYNYIENIYNSLNDDDTGPSIFLYNLYEKINRNKSKILEKAKGSKSYKSVWLFETYYGVPMFVTKMSDISKKGYIRIENDSKEVAWYNPETDTYWQNFGEFDKTGVIKKWVNQTNYFRNDYDSTAMRNWYECPRYANKPECLTYVDYDKWFTQGIQEIKHIC